MNGLTPDNILSEMIASTRQCCELKAATILADLAYMTIRMNERNYGHVDWNALANMELERAERWAKIAIHRAHPTSLSKLRAMQLSAVHNSIAIAYQRMKLYEAERSPETQPSLHLG